MTLLEVEMDNCLENLMGHLTEVWWEKMLEHLKDFEMDFLLEHMLVFVMGNW